MQNGNDNADPFCISTGANDTSNAPLTAQQQQQQQQQQRYYAYYMQQRQQQQYAQYYQALLKQRQQHQYAHYYRQIAQQYGYPAMMQAMNNDASQQQTLPEPPIQSLLQLPTAPHATTYYHPEQAQSLQASAAAAAALNSCSNHSSPHRRANGSIILSAEEQPLLMAAEKHSFAAKRRTGRSKPRAAAGRKRRRKRKKSESDGDDDDDDGDQDKEERSELTESGGSNYTRNQTVSLDIEEADDMLLGLDKDGYDRHTLINQNECLPDINEQFEEWLYFSKKLWKRQKKYKHLVVAHDELERARPGNHHQHAMDLSETISTSESPTRPHVHLKSVFMKDRARLRMNATALRKGNVLHKPKVVNVMIAMGLAPPWTQMLKYRKWSKCYNKCHPHPKR